MAVDVVDVREDGFEGAGVDVEGDDAPVFGFDAGADGENEQSIPRSSSLRDALSMMMSDSASCK